MGGKGQEADTDIDVHVMSLCLDLKMIEKKGGEVRRAEDGKRRNEKQEEGIEPPKN